MPMSPEELAHLQLRITADGQQYLKTLKDMDAATRHHVGGIGHQLEKLGEKFTDFTKDVGKDVASRMLGGMGMGGFAAGLATGIVHLVENAMEVTERYEKAEISLNSTLEANHRRVGETTEE